MKTLPSLLSLFALSFPLLAQEMPTPGPEHAKVTATAGTWDATLEMTGEDGEPATSKGVSVRAATLGGFWLTDHFTADFMGMKFQGFGMNGYDPLKGKYVSTWADSMSPHMMLMEGNYDKSGKVLTLTGTGIGMDGKPAPHRMVSTSKDANTEIFEMFVAMPDGKETKTMTITYKRRAEKAAPAPKK